MNCSEVESKIQFFIDEELPFAEVENIQKHLNLCPFCENKLSAEKAFFKQTLPEKLVRTHIADGTLETVRHYVLNSTL
jgi:hypothetical protein